jgi:hypothetical protein
VTGFIAILAFQFLASSMHDLVSTHLKDHDDDIDGIVVLIPRALKMRTILLLLLLLLLKVVIVMMTMMMTPLHHQVSAAIFTISFGFLYGFKHKYLTIVLIISIAIAGQAVYALK